MKTTMCQTRHSIRCTVHDMPYRTEKDTATYNTQRRHAIQAYTLWAQRRMRLYSYDS